MCVYCCHSANTNLSQLCSRLCIFSFTLCMIHAYKTPPAGRHSLSWSINGRDYHQVGTHSQARLDKTKTKIKTKPKWEVGNLASTHEFLITCDLEQRRGENSAAMRNSHRETHTGIDSQVQMNSPLSSATQRLLLTDTAGPVSTAVCTNLAK